jgi:2,4-dienoyl-CoA reductase-like NADH-dependent reductase (Old Yellow Enzyme family)
MIGVGRQAIADPDFARKITESRIGEIKWCITCQKCTMLLGANKRVGCPIFEREYNDLLKS